MKMITLKATLASSFMLILAASLINGRQHESFAVPFAFASSGRCGFDEATCRNGECVPRSSICDGSFDCRDHSDEANCGPPRKCEPNEFQCNNGQCVQKMWVCDREDDCGDNSDEHDCGTPAPGERCGPRDFACSTGSQCIPRGYQCDGQNDCQDGSDEHGCVDPTVVQPPPPQVDGCLGQSVTITCRAVGVPVPHITWRLNWGPVCEPPRCIQTSENGYGTFTINNLMERDQGAYTCEVLNSRKRLLAQPDAILTVKKCGPDGDDLKLCNPAGTLRVESDGRCVCKPYTTGPRCDQCSANCYFLSTNNPQGCIRCFCMGVTRDCRSSDLYRDQQRLAFRGNYAGVTISDFAEREIVQPVQIDFSTLPNAITVSGEQQQRSPGTILYWRLPTSFLGNKLGAYGGVIKFTIRYEGDQPETQEPLVILKGNEITLVHRPKMRLEPNIEHPIQIPIYETSFVREDGEHATHEHLLMTLANLEALLIRQTHCQNIQSSSLGEVSIDVAVQEPRGHSRALSVEQCSCPQEYVGTSCEDCAPGYHRSGGGLYLGTCVRAGEEEEPPTHRPEPTRRPAPPPSQCDPVGSVSPVPDRYSGQCICKEHTTGPRCDQCKAGCFLLHQDNPQGCIPCFCSGVTRQCESSSLYRQEKTTTNFRDWVRPVRTSDAENYKTLVTPAVASDDHSDLKFDAFHEHSNGQPLYISLPEEFLDNKIYSYGGKIRLRFTFEADSHIEDQNPCVILRGNDIALYHTTRQKVSSGQETVINIPIYENHFLRYDKHPSSREHLIMALAHLDDVLIKVSWAQNMRSFVLHEITFDGASHVPTHFGRASSVEQCSCPEGYIGSSCEGCATGFSRTGGGLYLGLCEPCFCNGHSEECDAETGECKNCQHNTEGRQCESCARGYSGDAQRGTPHDCRASGDGGRHPDPREGGDERERHPYTHPPYSREHERREGEERERHPSRSREHEGRDDEEGQGHPFTHAPHPGQHEGREGEEQERHPYTHPPRSREHEGREGEEQERHPYTHPPRSREHEGREGEEQERHPYTHPPRSREHEGREGEGQERHPQPGEHEDREGEGAERHPYTYPPHPREGDGHEGVPFTHPPREGGDEGEQRIGQEENDRTTEPPEYPHDMDEDSRPDRGDTQPGKNGGQDNLHASSLRQGCQDCECHNHSPTGCDGQCKCLECLDNTMGDRCEKCESGYYGEATEGTPSSCQKCPCPDAVECGISAEGSVVCHCPQGYSGEDCADCALGFKPDPQDAEKCIRDTLFYDQLKKTRRSRRRKFLKRALVTH